jgi:tetratricopeptide (TPR) repeat protein
MALARALTARCVWGWSSDIWRDSAAARAAAEQAVALDDRDPSAHYILSVCTLLCRRHEQALAEAQRAIDLCPNHALGFAALGWTRIFIGNFSEALDPLLRCLRLSPHDPLNFLFFHLMALALYHLGRYDEAAHHAERAVRGRRTHIALRTLLASLGQLGRTAEATVVRAEMEATTPADAERYWELTNPYADPAHLAHLVEGLRKAGVRV